MSDYDELLHARATLRRISLEIEQMEAAHADGMVEKYADLAQATETLNRIIARQQDGIETREFFAGHSR